MFYIIEEKSQLDHLINNHQDECYIQAITLNDQYHPKLTSLSLLYFKPKNDKSYIICLDHSESFSIRFPDLLILLKKYQSIYCLDKKFHMYFFPDLPLYDVNFVKLEQKGEWFEELPTTKVHERFYREHSNNLIINKIIPLTKHFERQEKIYNKIKNCLWQKPIDFYNNQYTEVFWKIEKEGIKIDPKKFNDHYILDNPESIIRDNKIYTNYKLYNTTSRPTNHIKNINFSAIPGDKKDSFIPENDIFYEIDYDCYHPRLIGRIIGSGITAENGHKQLASLYYNTPSPTQEQIDIAKKTTFKQLYRGIDEKYLDIEYFKKANEWMLQEEYIHESTGYVELFGGRKIQIKDPNRAKIASYTIQSAETFYNVEVLTKIFNKLQNKKTKLVHYTYDAFLFDISQDDGEGFLIEIQNLFKDNSPIKTNYGKNYKDMERINIY